MYLYMWKVKADPVICTDSLYTSLGCQTQSNWLMSGHFLCTIICPGVNTEVFYAIDQVAIGWGRVTWPCDPKYCSRSRNDMKSIALLKQISVVTLSAEGLNEEGCWGDELMTNSQKSPARVNGNMHVNEGNEIWLAVLPLTEQCMA